jgi:hypothetical protein
MKIKQNAPQNLVLEDTPWLVGIGTIVFTLFLFGVGISGLISGQVKDGLGFIGVGAVFLGVAAYFVQRVQVILNAEDDTLTIRRSSYLRRSQITHRLQDVVCAELDITQSTDDGGFDTDDGDGD